MRQIRLYLDDSLVQGQAISLGAEQQNYLRNVLRVKRDDELILFNGDGNNYPAIVGAVSKKNVELIIQDCLPVDLESPLQIHIGQAITKGDRMDLSVQKAVELGVQEITPLFSQFGVVALKGERLEKKHQHWQKVANAASEQCGRTRITRVHEPQSLSQWLAAASQDGALKLVASPRGRDGITSQKMQGNSFQVLIGPEGGLSDEEVVLAENSGFFAFTLGPRVLRAETATMAIVSAIQVIWGDMR